MASHQQRREPLPADYQFPTHGVDCDCPPCRNDVVMVKATFEHNGTTYSVDIPQPLEPTADTPWGV